MRVVQAALLVGLLHLTLPAPAQEATTGADDREAATQAGNSDTAVDAARAHALELAEQASVLYDHGAFGDAVSLLEKAYAEFHEPILLYDIGRAQEGLGADEAAIAAYEKYLAARAEITNRGAIERRLETLRQRVAATRRRAAESAATPPPTPPRSVTATATARSEQRPSALRQAAPWLVTGAGALTLASGGVLWLLAVDRHELAQADAEFATAERHQRQAVTLAQAATVTGVVGGVLTAAGATWTIVTLATSRRPARDAPRVGIGLGASTLRLWGRF